MRISLYLDEDASSDGLRDALLLQQIDVRTVSEEGIRGYSDEEQLLYAKVLGRVIYSFNQADFMALHTKFLREGLSHAGIILAPQQRYSIGEQMRRIRSIMETRSAQEMENQVEFLSNWG